MALSRAFTKKEKGPAKEDRPSMPQAPSRSFFSSNKPAPSIRNKISSPLSLISTTNQLAYNAPDLFPNSNSSTPVSVTSNTFTSLTLSTSIGTPISERDEVPELLHSNSSTPDSSTRGSTPTSTEPNHLSGYFAAAVAEKRKSDEAPQRTLSRAGKVGELLGRKRSESRVRSPSGSLGHGAARKPTLQSIDSTGLKSANSSTPSWNSSPTTTTTLQFAPAPFSSSKNNSPITERFAPAAFSSAPKSAGLAPSGGGLMRKGTIRARGSVDMFSPNMGVTPEQHNEKPSISNLRERRAEDAKPRNHVLNDRPAPEQEKPSTVKPSNSIRDRQILNPSLVQDRRGPISPRAAASHADLRGQAHDRHPALRAKASLNIRPNTADKVIPPARSFTTGGDRPMEREMRKASPIDEAMATLDEVAKDFNVERQVKREEKKQIRTVGKQEKPRTRIVEGQVTIMGVDCERFTAVDYMSEIQDLTELLFPELRYRREKVEGKKDLGMRGVVEAAQMREYNMI